ncbi:MAG TPA: serine/threonine-protein kinase [Planctomycetota bacterium]|nr:serine/threonine-protein kinase [Planctomycetota bacterium]
MSICPKCHHSNNPDALACASCGENFGPAAPENPATLLGRIVNGKYEVLSILGEGGMGIVYKVRHLILQNKTFFALKVLHPRFCTQTDFQARFLREVEIAMELTHENIIQIRDFGVTEENHLFYTMDYFGGKDLKHILREEKVLLPDRVTRIARQVLLALAEAHRAGIVHRDLKPDNILIQRGDGDREKIRILDFGIAKILVGNDETDDSNLTQGAAIGTPRYMSPEQASSEPVDGRSDLYSLGIIIYEMLTGRVPFNGTSQRAVLLGHLTLPPPPLAEARPGLKVPRRLEKLLYELLEKSPAARPASAEEVLAELKGETGSHSSVPGGVRGMPRALRRGLFLTRAGALLVAALAVAAVLHFQTKPGGKASADAAARGLEIPPGAEEPLRVPEPIPSVPEPTLRVPEPKTPVRAVPPARGNEKLRCLTCGTTYAAGEKDGSMCHGEPLVPVVE